MCHQLCVFFHPTNQLLSLLNTQTHEGFLDVHDIGVQKYGSSNLYNLCCLRVELRREVILNVLKVPLCQYIVDIVIGDGQFCKQGGDK